MKWSWYFLEAFEVLLLDEETTLEEGLKRHQ